MNTPKFLKKIRSVPRPVIHGVAGIIRLLGATIRLTVRDPEQTFGAHYKPPIIFVLWHNRLLCVPVITPRMVRATTSVLISQSRDGAYVSALVEAFGFQSVRGSSSKGGPRALRQLAQELERGRSIAMTPDGPRGPKYQIQNGVIWLAATTKAPVVPVSLNVRGHWQLKGWDRTQVPKPFSCAELVIGPRIMVATDPNSPDAERWREMLRQRLMEITCWD